MKPWNSDGALCCGHLMMVYLTRPKLPTRRMKKTKYEALHSTLEEPESVLEGIVGHIITNLQEGGVPNGLHTTICALIIGATTKETRKQKRLQLMGETLDLLEDWMIANKRCLDWLLIFYSSDLKKVGG